MAEQAPLQIITPTIAGSTSIATIGSSLGPVGTRGAASFELPLPMSSARHLTPPLVLQYSSQSGNGTFGIGMQLSLPSIRRRTSNGVPLYNEEDVMVGPDGVERWPDLDAQTSRKVGDRTFATVRYYPRVESTFDIYELWTPIDDLPFWRVQGSNGHLYCYGKSEASRIVEPEPEPEPEPPTRIAEWLLLEEVSPLGEHIYYEYAADPAVSDGPHDYRAQRYLRRVCYGNVTASETFYCFEGPDPATVPWHFHLLFDYGQRPLELEEKPTWTPVDEDAWQLRSDPFHSYRYGFEIGTRRLCHQVLMFHRFPADAEPALVRRLLLEYTSTALDYSLLTAVHYQDWDAEGRVKYSPPVELQYSDFAPDVAPKAFFALETMPALEHGRRYQCVDLYGEGVPGFLCRYSNGWYYREPERATTGDSEAIGYGPWTFLPSIPVAAENSTVMQLLTDLTGSGRLNWVIAQPGTIGFYTLNPDRSWSAFTDFKHFPVEFLHPAAQLGDLAGDGLHSLAMIGPNSVRLYANLREEGFAAGVDVPHEPDSTLPLFSGVRSELVLLGNMLGSDSTELVRIRFDEIKCWPNLGHGHFGAGFVMSPLPFNYEEFNTERVRIADVDGSGAPSLIYLRSDCFEIYFNHGGNGLEQTPLQVSWPDGLRYDNLCQVTLADLQGLGCASLILSVPHHTPDMKPRHWRYDFVAARPYMLSATNNNMGCSSTLTYRSSAQFWLDEKAQRVTKDEALDCYLPMALPLVARQQQMDEITGNCLTQRFTYYEGDYDSYHREFRGFGRLYQFDSELPSEDRNSDFTAPVLAKTWFHTGRTVDQPLRDCFDADQDAPPLGPTLLTQFHEHDEADQIIVPDPDTARDMAYVLSGHVLRSETHNGVSTDMTKPYTVARQRYLLRYPHDNQKSLLVLALETATHQYDGFINDPQAQHTVNLGWNRYGQLAHGFIVHYARRLTAASPPPFEDEDEINWWRDAHDDQQQVFHIIESRAEYLHLVDDSGQRQRLGLPWRARTNGLQRSKGQLPEGLNPQQISYECFLDHQDSEQWTAARVLIALEEQTYLRDDADDILFQALRGPLEVAEFDKQALDAYDAVPGQFDIREALAEIGFEPMKLFLPEDTEQDALQNLWSKRVGFATYLPLEGFFHIRALQETQSHGVTTVEYDDYHLMPAVVTLPDGCATHVEYHYHSLLPQKIIDANDNLQEALYGPAGVPLGVTFHGTENAAPAGFDAIDTYTPPDDLSPAHAIEYPATTLANMASAVRVEELSWMGTLDLALVLPVQRDEWIDARYILPSGHIRASARVRLARLQTHTVGEALLRALVQATPREPAHSVMLSADRYPDDELRQIRIAISAVDGFGRPLQSKQLVEPGQAYAVAEDGSLRLGDDGRPIQQDADPRWRVSERVEYNNKGLVTRVYRPYFADDWHYVNDASLREHGYHDQQFYDPPGRLVKVVNAKGHEAWHVYHPWYQCDHDYNDTDTGPAQ
ncbi:SpvB/TcaC N-terminal domain-containing protein [Pseudomonas thivervalensis]|uniref:Toxin n=1 Tax=Pseudomonas thivervalensis TaxID=86265 RepID=A0A2Z4ZZG2_9PSED|nr:SpvB/TcaC N-terminal domain-containing protein [Pseudomonas thivervalensis]AXA56898.1 toxin [Pseudomonas thivervalensis]AXA62711.1 toxin [Pseudomonas thivervalensis]